MKKKIIVGLLTFFIALGVLILVQRPQLQPANTTKKVESGVLTESKKPKYPAVVFTAKLLFIGDTMLARTIGEQILAGKNPFIRVQKTLDSYDLKIANIETTIADPLISHQAARKLFTFNAPLAAIQTLKQAKIDVAVLANNHTRDFGPLATENMIASLQNAGIKTVGAGKNVDAAFRPLVVNIPLKSENTSAPTQKIKLAIIGVNQIENSFTNASATLAGSAFFDQTRIANAIKTARETDKAEIVVVFPHWGKEYQINPNTDQVSWAHFFIDSGADIVIGSHPHVVQTTENYKGKYIVYSLGNFIFDGMGGSALNGQIVGLNINLKAEVDSSGKFQAGTGSLLVEPPISIPTQIDDHGFPVIK